VAGFDAALPQFDAAAAQVVGVSADAWQALAG
jgi:peroxiredoxin